MKTHQITVEYSTTFEISLPENITPEQFLAACDSRRELCPEMEALVARILQEAHANTGWRDGEVTDISPA
jgi:hypothetical protein